MASGSDSLSPPAATTKTVASDFASVEHVAKFAIFRSTTRRLCNDPHSCAQIALLASWNAVVSRFIAGGSFHALSAMVLPDGRKISLFEFSGRISSRVQDGGFGVAGFFAFENSRLISSTVGFCSKVPATSRKALSGR